MESLTKYAILVSYKGTPFCGWQRQAAGVSGPRASIQESLELALSRVTQESPAIVGSGRTDTGVHATGQVAHFVLKRADWDPERIRRGMNSQLGHAIRVLKIAQVPIEFHAQRSAVSKQYGYYYQQGPDELPPWAA
jgi:tRNA pseudouridine38-40 synthase